MTRFQLPAFSPVSFGEILLAALQSTWNRGHFAESLSALLRSRFGCGKAIPTGSGTEALELALRSCRGPKGEVRAVALPAYSCYDLISAAIGSESPVLFYDLDPDTLSPDPDSLEAAIHRGAETVVVGNLYGFPLPWRSIGDLCRDAGVMVVEDFAQGVGSSWGESPGGSFGDMTVLSFGRGKGWAGGGGGALLIRREDVASTVSRFRLRPAPFGASPRSALMSTLQWLFGRPSLYWLPSMVPGLGLGETRFREPRPPTDIPTFSAALAFMATENATQEVGVRRRNAQRLRGLLSRCVVSEKLRIPSPLHGGEAGFLRFPVLDFGVSRLLGQSKDARSLGILRGYPRPLVDLPEGKALHLAPQLTDYPGSRLLAEHLVTFPTHRLVDERDLTGLSKLLAGTC
jgi:perosamine synthetase